MAKKKEMGMMYKCCMSGCGIIHMIGGVGLAFLLVEYFRLGNLLLWGWALLAIAILGHLMGKTKCEA